MLKELLIGAGIIAGWLWLRRWRWKQLDEELKRPIVTKDELKHRLADHPRYRVVEPAAVAGVTAYDAVHALAMMDERVLEAMDFSSKLNLDTFNSTKTSYILKLPSTYITRFMGSMRWIRYISMFLW